MIISVVAFASHAIAEIDVIKTAQQLNPIVYMQMRDKPEAEKLAKLDKIEQQIKGELADNKNRPELYWLLGLHAWAKLYAWDKPVPIEKNRAQKAIASKAFRKALELDNSDAPILSVDILYSMKKFASSDVHVEAARRIFKEDQNLEPRKELDMRGEIIQHLLRLKRYDDVMKEIEIIEQKFTDTEYAKGARSHYTKVIKKAKQAALVEKTEQTKTLVLKEMPVVAEQPKQSAINLPPSKPTLPKTEPVPDNKLGNRVGYLALGVLVILMAGIVLLRRRGKK